jgi:hypothetical protein
MLKGGFYAFSNVPRPKSDKEYHSLAQFQRMFEHLGIEYETIPPDKFSPDTRDIIGLIKLKIDGHEIYFDNAERFITIKET